MVSNLLTTGEVARLCGVTPDAVLKWIKKGKLPATRTPGGHYRVARADCEERGLGRSGHEPDPEQAVTPAAQSAGVLRCWEYFSDHGEPRAVCRSCLVFRARAQNCHLLAALGERAGHRRHFCPTESCEDCSFFRNGHGLACSVLVVTRDEERTRRLPEQVDASRVALRFARSGYEASMAVGDLCPAVIVMDAELPEVRDGSLPETIRRDERIPGVTLVIACRTADRAALAGLGLPLIEAPLTPRGLENLAERRVEDCAHHAWRPRPVDTFESV